MKPVDIHFEHKHNNNKRNYIIYTYEDDEKKSNKQVNEYVNKAILLGYFIKRQAIIFQRQRKREEKRNKNKFDAASMPFDIVCS